MIITKKYLKNNVNYKTPKMMAEDKNVSVSTIRRRMKKYNINPVLKKTVNKNYILKHYKKKSIPLLAADLQISEEYVSRIMRSLKLDLNDHKRYYESKKIHFLGGYEFLKACKDNNVNNNFELREKLGHSEFVKLAMKLRREKEKELNRIKNKINYD